MTRQLLLIAALTAVSSVAHAQVVNSPDTDLSIASFDPAAAVSPISVVQGPGIRVGEGTIFHPVAGLETGIVSNVFYRNTGAVSAGLLRALLQGGISSQSGARMDPSAGGIGPADFEQGDISYQLYANLAYDQLLSGDPVVRSTGGLNIGVTGKAMIHPAGPLSFGVDEEFLRMIRAANFETSTNNNRDVNNLGLLMFYHPPGNTFSGYAYYHNTVDVFEDAATVYPDRMDNRVGLHPMWRVLPQTLLWADVSEGVVTGLGSSAASAAKVTSYPFAALLGITTVLTPTLTAGADAGYANAFYSSGPSFSGPRVNLSTTYYYSPFGRVSLNYAYSFSDSINASFFSEHVIRAYVAHAFVPFVFVAGPELHLRSYDGVMLPGAPTTRSDIIVAAVAGIHYNFRNWLAATVDYRFSTVQTDFRYMVGTETINPSYVDHELLAGVRAAL